MLGEDVVLVVVVEADEVLVLCTDIEVGIDDVLDMIEEVVETGPVKRHEQALETRGVSPEH